ncbi:MAG: SDR family NAD(P)-dependent oxidoreductase [Candidatus Kapaibacterium sp.]
MKKTILITGATSGVGKSLSKMCAKAGYEVIMTGRNKEKAEAAYQDVIRYSGNKSVRLILADLSSLKEIEKLASEVISNYTNLNVLVNNAGLSLPKRELSTDGIEKVFATNHIGYFYLTELLLDLLKSSSPSRIINVASEAHSEINFNDLMSEKKYHQLKTYGSSKTANIMFTYELAERLKGSDVTVNCLHPGAVRSRIYDNVPFFAKILITLIKPFFISSDKSAGYIFPLVSSKEYRNVTGKYFIKGKEMLSKEFTYNKEVHRKLWEITENIISERKTEFWQNM